MTLIDIEAIRFSSTPLRSLQYQDRKVFDYQNGATQESHTGTP